MEKFLRSFASYFIPNEDFTVGLTSFKLKQKPIVAPKIAKVSKSTLSFGLLHK